MIRVYAGLKFPKLLIREAPANIRVIRGPFHLK